jgi:hypothetical protein
MGNRFTAGSRTTYDNLIDNDVIVAPVIFDHSRRLLAGKPSFGPEANTKSFLCHLAT